MIGCKVRGQWKHHGCEKLYKVKKKKKKSDMKCKQTFEKGIFKLKKVCHEKQMRSYKLNLNKTTPQNWTPQQQQFSFDNQAYLNYFTNNWFIYIFFKMYSCDYSFYNYLSIYLILITLKLHSCAWTLRLHSTLFCTYTVYIHTYHHACTTH